ncbi:uncharacterized protein LOC142923007 [Petromyzon marinus]|uniref:uncharacterized protein LOC142922774 n=1 Tax=Petromyzon marinus TaxID=7757 RepID=UPI003F6EF546
MEAHGLRSTSRTLVTLLVASSAFLASVPTEEKNFSPNWLVKLRGAWEVQLPQAGQPLPLTKATVAVHISNRLTGHEAERVPRVASSPSHGMEVPQGGGEDDDPAPSGWTTFMEMLHSGPVAIAYEVASAGITLLSLGVAAEECSEVIAAQTSLPKPLHERKLARSKCHPMKIKRTHRSLKTQLDGCSMMNSSPTLTSAPTNSTTSTNTTTPTNTTIPTNTTMTNPTPKNTAISTNTITLLNTNTSTNTILTNTTTPSTPTNPTNSIFSTFTTTRTNTIIPAECEWCHLMIMARINARRTKISSITPTSSITNSTAPTNSATLTNPTFTNITSSTLTTTPTHITPAEHVSSLMIMREKRSLFMAG